MVLELRIGDTYTELMLDEIMKANGYQTHTECIEHLIFFAFLNACAGKTLSVPDIKAPKEYSIPSREQQILTVAKMQQFPFVARGLLIKDQLKSTPQFTEAEIEACLIKHNWKSELNNKGGSRKFAAGMP